MATNEPRTYRATVSCLSKTGVPFRLKWTATGRTKGHAALDCLRRVWVMFPTLREARVGGMVWVKVAPGLQTQLTEVGK